MNMRNSLLLLAIFTFAACSNEETAPDQSTLTTPVTAPSEPADVPAKPDSGGVQLHSLEGSGLKFHGVYDSPTSGNVHYFMRFFERGNVALVAGRQEPNDPTDLRSLLTENVQSGKNNIHNVPVTRRGDSLFFSTMAIRGAINYAGVLDGDSLRFLKHSKATGKKAVVSYGFLPDGASLK